MDKKYTSEYWENIAVGDIIQLTDEQTIEHLLDQGKNDVEHGADFEVKRIKDITEQQGLAKWKFVYIELDEILWFLVIKFLGEDVEIRIYYQPDDFECGTKADLVNSDFQWLFEEPKDTDNYNPADLDFTQEIEQDDGSVFTTEAIMFGESKEDGDTDFATIIEYSTEAECDNPNILILELCSTSKETDVEETELGTITETDVEIDSDNGFVMLLYGCPAKISEVELLK